MDQPWTSPKSNFPFTIITTISREEYNRWMQTLVRTKKVTWISPLIGAVLIVGTLIGLISTGFRNIEILRIIPLLAGIGLVWSWYRFRSFFGKKYDMNPRMHHPIAYTFSNDGVMITGHDFKSEFGWGNIQKIRIMDEFILLYLTPRLAEIIKRSSLTNSQVDIIQSRITH